MIDGLLVSFLQCVICSLEDVSTVKPGKVSLFNDDVYMIGFTVYVGRLSFLFFFILGLMSYKNVFLLFTMKCTNLLN